MIFQQLQLFLQRFYSTFNPNRLWPRSPLFLDAAPKDSKNSTAIPFPDDVDPRFSLTLLIIDVLRLFSDDIYLFDSDLSKEASKSLTTSSPENIFQRNVNLTYSRTVSMIANTIVQQQVNFPQKSNSIFLSFRDFVTCLPIAFAVRGRPSNTVFHIFCESNDDFIDLSNILTIRDIGIQTVFSSTSGNNVQDIVDTVVNAHLLSILTNSPVIHCFVLSNSESSVKDITIPSLDELLKLLPEDKISSLNENNEEIIQNSDSKDTTNLYLRTYIEPQDVLTTTNIVSKLFKDYSSISGRNYNVFERYGPSDAKLVIVMLICNVELLTTTLLNELNNLSISIILPRIYRPWSSELFLETLGYQNTKRIVVLEQSSFNSNSSIPSLYQDVISSISSDSKFNDINVSYYSYSSTNISNDSLQSIYNGIAPKLNTNSINEQVSNNIVSESLYYDDSKKAAEQYLKVINHVIGENNAEIFMFDSKINNQSITSAEYAFGVFLNKTVDRDNFINNIKNMIESSSTTLSDKIINLLKEWYSNRDDFQITSTIFTSISNYLNENNNLSNNEINYLKDNLSLFIAKSYWIIGGEEWMYDIMASGIHTILSSKKNINLLLVNTTLIDSSNQMRRKDIGLFGMNYGTAYIAGVAAFGSYSQLTRSVSEAIEYNGPSILVAYTPIRNNNELNQNNNNIELYSLIETKKAIDNGIWPLYRYNPKSKKEYAFELDSNTIKKDIENFLKRENQLALLSDENLNFTGPITSNLNSEIQQKHKKIQLSYNQLISNINTPKRSLLILYGSDGGNAEEAAKIIGEDAKIMKYSPSIYPMNDISLDDVLSKENIIIFLISTAGQGEFPSNSKETWNEIENSPTNDLFKGIRYSVFALGDSNYWPDERVFFCKSGRDLDYKIDELGGERLCNLGIGDDQDDDGWNSGFEEWRILLWKSLGCDIDILGNSKKEKVKPDDEIKSKSNFLRGTIAEGLIDKSTLALSYENTKLTKFHGIYQQDDRDLREERRKQGLEKAYSFMVRIRAPAGVCTPKQWQMFDKLSSDYGNETFKLTTRQAVQLHGILKFNLKSTIKDINQSLMDTLAACGDVNRNVMCNPNPKVSKVFEEIHVIASKLSEHLTPRTSAYHEIWLDKKKVSGDEIGDIEPIYGPNYLPRKFKIAIAVPPYNDVDVLAHCLGFIAIIKDEKLLGFNVTIGGGMGMTHNNPKTYPCLGDTLGFCLPEEVIPISEAILIVQRDFGDRVNRKHARLKYTLEDNGMDWFRNKVEEIIGYKIKSPRPFKFKSNGDRYGWIKGIEDTWHYTMWIENGRIRDIPGYPLRTALLELSKIHNGDFRITPNQNLIISNVKDEEKPIIQALFDKYKIDNSKYSGLRLNSIACVALPTCGLALAESERYLPVLIDKLDNIIDKFGLKQDSITIRMSGCPNGCSRPYVAEIALVGRAPGIYNLYLGGGFDAQRLCKLYKDSVNEDEIIEALTPILEDYANSRNENEKFGDFVIRKEYVKETFKGSDFHK